MTKNANRQAASILAATLLSFREKPRFELGLEFDESYSYTNNSSYDEY